MSEFQRISFRAIDGPLSEENLKYMRKQSSRAKVSRWGFDNEYNYGDFGGDEKEMLRRGYDFHLHYANFGVRTLMFRLPHGLPDPEAAAPYFDEDGLSFEKDKSGPGGILVIQPMYESGDLDELWNFGGLIERLAGLRAEILDGDLRPLYLAHLAIATDSDHDPAETTEGPVPSGLDRLTEPQRALVKFYGLGKALVAAAAKGASPKPGDGATAAGATQGAGTTAYREWLAEQPATRKDAWLATWMAEPQADLRREILAEFRASSKAPSWPTIQLGRTIEQLEASAERLRKRAEEKANEKAAREKAKRLAAMAADPRVTLRETEKLVEARSVANYEKAASLLVELREALADSEQNGLAEEQARKLKKKNPTLNHLTSELRRKGLLGKKE